MIVFISIKKNNQTSQPGYPHNEPDKPHMSRLSTIYRAGGTNGNVSSNRRHLQLTPAQDAFPLLDAKEITVCLSSCDFISTEELVSKPTSQFIRALFEQFLDTFMGLSTESLQKRLRTMNQDSSNGQTNGNRQNGHSTPDNNQQNAEDDEEEDTASAMNIIVLHRAASKFLQGCGIYDLTLMDIKRPEPFRIRRILSAVVNFTRFREEHSAECEKLVLESEASLEKIKKAQADNSRITQQLTDLKSKIEDDNDSKKSTLKQVNSYNSRLESELKKLKRAQEIVTSNHTQYKEEKSRLIEKLDDIQYLIFESNRELERNKIYSETDLPVLNKIIDDLRNQLNELHASIESTNQKESNISITIQSIQTVENELKNLFRIIEEISSDLGKQREASQRLNNSQEYLDQLNSQSNDLSRQIQQLQRQLVNMQEKTNKLKVQADERMAKSQSQLANFREDYSKLVEERNLKEQEHSEKKKLIRELETSTSNLRLDFQNEERSVELKIARLNARIKLYMEEVGKKVQI